MRILMIYPGMVENLPPLLAATTCMRREGAEVILACAGANAATCRHLADAGIRLESLRYASYPNTLWGKALLRVQFFRLLRRVATGAKPDVLWLHGAHAMAYARFERPGARLIVAHCHELHLAGFNEPALESAQRRAVRMSSLYIVPERNRGWILKGLYQPRASFLVCPNRLPNPVIAPLAKQPGKETANRLFAALGGETGCTRFAIYQGRISSERRVDLVVSSFLAAAVPHTGLIVMGPIVDAEGNRGLRAAIGNSKRVVVSPNIPAPGHLEITAGCSAGYIIYDDRHLNHIYCAPNKIYEYAAFGLGMIMPDYPPLFEINGKYEVGKLFAMGNEQSMIEAVRRVFLQSDEHWKQRAQLLLRGEPTAEEAYSAVACAVRGLMGRAI